MKIKHFFLLAIAALTLSACTIAEESTISLRPIPEAKTEITIGEWEVGE